MNMFHVTRLPYEAIAEVDFSKCTDFYCTFQYATIAHLPSIDMRAATRTNNAFSYMGALEIIDELKVSETTPYTSIFGSCAKLREVRFSGVIAQNGLNFKDCKNLSRASIESVIEHLSDSTSGLTVTFWRDAINKAFESGEGDNDGDQTSEWGELCNSKKNWTIALV